MYNFYATTYEEKHSENFSTKYIFVSRRLAKMLKIQMEKSKLPIPLWPLKNVIYYAGEGYELYNGELISCKGTIIFTKGEKDENY